MNSERPPLPAPLLDLLRPLGNRPALQRMRARVLDQQPGERRSRRAWGWGLAGVATALGLFLVLYPRKPLALLTHDGREFSELSAQSGAARQEFADGSSLWLATGGHVVGLSSTEQEFSVLLERGSIDVHVVPGGPRRWVVEAKWARIEVVGTRFRIERRPHGVHVSVSEGIVLVRSTHLAEGVTRLSAGADLDVGPGPRAASLDDATAAASAAAATTAAHSIGAPTLPLQPPQDAPEGAPDTKASSSPSPRSASVTELLAAADEARGRGAWTEAEKSLQRIVREHSSDNRSSLSGYGLGVVQLRQGKQMAAIQSFEWVLGQRPPRTLWEDTLLRLVEVYSSLGQPERAAERAADYRVRFPEGRHRGTIDLLVPPAP